MSYSAPSDRHYQSPTAGRVRRFRILHYYLVGIFQCRNRPVLFLIKDHRCGCDGLLYHGDGPPNIDSVIFIIRGCTLSSPSVFTFLTHSLSGYDQPGPTYVRTLLPLFAESTSHGI